MKYTFTGKTKTHRGRVLRQIMRVSDKRIGGWIEGEHNLSQLGNCFVYEEGYVFGNGFVGDNAKVSFSSVVFENGSVLGNAVLTYNSVVRSNATVYENAYVENCSVIDGNAVVHGNAQVNLSVVKGTAKVCGNALIHKNLILYAGTYDHDSDDQRK